MHQQHTIESSILRILIAPKKSMHEVKPILVELDPPKVEVCGTEHGARERRQTARAARRERRGGARGRDTR